MIDIITNHNNTNQLFVVKRQILPCWTYMTTKMSMKIWFHTHKYCLMCSSSTYRFWLPIWYLQITHLVSSNSSYPVNTIPTVPSWYIMLYEKHTWFSVDNYYYCIIIIISSSSMPMIYSIMKPQLRDGLIQNTHLHHLIES